MQPTIGPLGDQAALVQVEREADAFRLAALARREAPPWLVDVVQAYASVGIYFDLDRVRYREVEQWLAGLLTHPEPAPEQATQGKLHGIPCCYDFPLDQARVAERTGLHVEEVIQMHTGSVYTVYAIGFCPGFPYLGYLPAALSGVPRLPTPRVRVEEGSVGLTGRQTGIYTQPKPGGWNLVGKTPLVLVDVAGEYFPLRTGDRVQFRRIGLEEYRDLAGSRLKLSKPHPASPGGRGSDHEKAADRRKHR